MGLIVKMNGNDMKLIKETKEVNIKKEQSVKQEAEKEPKEKIIIDDTNVQKAQLDQAPKEEGIIEAPTIEKEEVQVKSKDWIANLKYTDDATKVMLQNVIKRKQKYLTYERKHLITMICMFVCVLGYLVYLYNEVLKPYAYSFGDVFHAMISNSINGYILIIIFGLYATMEYFYKKREKAEKEFHLLRCEIIDKSKDLWREEAWKHRADIFEMMKNKHDINLYHENK